MPIERRQNRDPDNRREPVDDKRINHVDHRTRVVIEPRGQLNDDARPDHDQRQRKDRPALAFGGIPCRAQRQFFAQRRGRQHDAKPEKQISGRTDQDQRHDPGKGRQSDGNDPDRNRQNHHAQHHQHPDEDGPAQISHYGRTVKLRQPPRCAFPGQRVPMPRHRDPKACDHSK